MATEKRQDEVTYIVVVHGIGEQRKNETVISVVNRFEEARGKREEEDNRDVLTLGHASGQTGVSKVPETDCPWMAFRAPTRRAQRESGAVIGFLLGQGMTQEQVGALNASQSYQTYNAWVSAGKPGDNPPRRKSSRRRQNGLKPRYRVVRAADKYAGDPRQGQVLPQNRGAHTRPGSTEAAAARLAALL